jgi:hypothetical protein
MEEILEWLSTYSWPVVLLICLGGILLYFAKLVTENAIKHEMDRYAKTLELTLQRRSNFEERILTERYAVLREISNRLMKVATDINRLHNGHQVDNLIVNGDLVPLTEVFELIALNRHLIPDPFPGILEEQAQMALKFGNAGDPGSQAALTTEIQFLREKFDAEMVHHFGLNAIDAKTGS